jgi:hypothetical protein
MQTSPELIKMKDLNSDGSRGTSNDVPAKAIICSFG